MTLSKLRKRLKKTGSPRSKAKPTAPTMIVPRGADLRVDQHGHLSIRTPGNLVIQTSGAFGAIESISGSVRIEPEVKVEAITVRCAETCYVQGSLTAWKVTARSIEVAENAEAKIVLQQTERLEVGKGARLVGNFSSEKELYNLFSRYAAYFDEKSFPVDAEVRRALLEAGGGDGESQAEALVEEEEEEAELLAAGRSRPGAPPPAPLDEVLEILDREVGRQDHDGRSKRQLREMASLIRGGELETLKHTHATLFGRVGKQTRAIRKAARLIREFF